MVGVPRYVSTIFIAKAVAVIGVCGLLASCSGHVYTLVKPLNPEKVYGDKVGYEGVIFYLPNHFLEISWTTAIVKDGKVTHTASAAEADKKCIQQMQLKETVRADFDQPYQLLYVPGYLEKYTWKAEFDQGMLKSINTDSTPDRGETIKNLASAAKDMTSIIAGGPALDNIGGAPCTDLPQLTYIVKVSKACPEGKCSLQDYSPKPESQKPKPKLPVQ